MIRLQGGLSQVPAFSFSAAAAGIKRKGLDVALIRSDLGPVPAAGVFTTNVVKAESLKLTMRNLCAGKLAAVFVNSGCANCMTGERGARDALEITRLVAQSLGLRPGHIGILSTGLIGTYLPMEGIRRAIPELVASLSSTPEQSRRVAEAMMTTDTFPKEVAYQAHLRGRKIHVAGVAKGSGMIHPRMGTMLCILLTDAKLPADGLRRTLKKAVDQTFNMITVDGDTSTNDSVILMANGLAGRVTEGEFLDLLVPACEELAKLIVRDGEGAEHMFEVEVRGARTLEEARRAARAITSSNLVKAAIFGEDPNWGRVVAALGSSGARFDPGETSLWLEARGRRVQVLERGKLVSSPQEMKGILSEKEFKIGLDLKSGKGSARAWGCDLTYEYVRINARLRT